MNKKILLKKGTKISLFDMSGSIYIPEDLHEIYAEKDMEFDQSQNEIHITTSTKKIIAHYFFKKPFPTYEGIKMSAFIWEIK